MYILTCVWVLHTPNIGPNILIHIFRMKNVKDKKEGKMKQNMAKIRAFILWEKFDYNVGIQWLNVVQLWFFNMQMGSKYQTVIYN